MTHCIGAVSLPSIATGIAVIAILFSGPAGGSPGQDQPSSRTRQSGGVQDIDGNSYQTVTIGTRMWMAANLRTTRYRDGTPIPVSTNASTWSKGLVGAYCMPESDRPEPEVFYGLLYNWAAVNDRHGLCPDGWHVPTADQWHALVDHLGGPGTAGGSMKDIESGLWRTAVDGATNSSGFSALPAGGRGRLGDASDAGFFATWWSATSHDSTSAWHWGLFPDTNAIRFNPGHTSSGFSVRCVQD